MHQLPAIRHLPFTYNITAASGPSQKPAPSAWYQPRLRPPPHVKMADEDRRKMIEEEILERVEARSVDHTVPDNYITPEDAVREVKLDTTSQDPRFKQFFWGK